MECSGAGGKLIHEKNQKQKISWHCPFKLVQSNEGAIVDSIISRVHPFLHNIRYFLPSDF